MGPRLRGDDGMDELLGSAADRPHGGKPPAQRVRLFHEHARGKARGAGDMGRPALGNRRCKARAPRERLMRFA
jgi:hypothetical protein